MERPISSAECSADPAQQIDRVDAELVQQGCVLFGVDDFWKFTLRAIGDVVLTSAAELVDDLLPVDLHIDTIPS